MAQEYKHSFNGRMKISADSTRGERLLHGALAGQGSSFAGGVRMPGADHDEADQI